MTQKEFTKAAQRYAKRHNCRVRLVRDLNDLRMAARLEWEVKTGVKTLTEARLEFVMRYPETFMPGPKHFTEFVR